MPVFLKVIKKNLKIVTQTPHPRIYSFESLTLMYQVIIVIPQVYVRRAYIAYEVNCLQHRELNGDMSMVEFKFLLPRSHPNR